MSTELFILRDLPLYWETHCVTWRQVKTKQEKIEEKYPLSLSILHD